MSVLVVGGRIGAADAAALCERVRARCADGHAGVLVCDVAGLADPDLAAVDVLARMQLTARRLGCVIALQGASAELLELVELCGLGDILPPSEASRPAAAGGRTAGTGAACPGTR